MPLPMTPTVLTVLTTAWTSASRMFPSTRSVMTACSVIPVWPNLDGRSVLGFRQDVGHLLSHLRVDDADTLDPRPRERFVDQELGLLATLSVRVLLGVLPTPVANHRPIDLVQAI